MGWFGAAVPREEDEDADKVGDSSSESLLISYLVPCLLLCVSELGSQQGLSKAECPQGGMLAVASRS